jgi:hypothetical protein
VWKTHKEACISQCSCEVEIKATDVSVKHVHMFITRPHVHHILSDLTLLHLSTPTTTFNDNCGGAFDWSHSFSTKGMRHLNIRENSVCEA